MEYISENNYTDHYMMTIDNNATTPSAEVIRQKLDLINLKETIQHAPVLAFYIFIMLVGLIGNTLVLYIYKTKFKRTSARTYILCLALVDFLVCCVGLPYHTFDLTHLVTYYRANVCRALSYLSGAVNIGSAFVLVVVAVDRYRKVCLPMKKQVVDFGDRKACVIAIISAIIISVPNAILYGRSSVKKNIHGLNLTGIECFIDDEYEGSAFALGYLSLYMLIFIICVLTLIVLYTFICREIHRNQAIQTDQTSYEGGLCSCTSATTDDSDTDSEYTGERRDTVATSSACGLVSEGERLVTGPLDTTLELQQKEMIVKFDSETNVTIDVVKTGNGIMTESAIKKTGASKLQGSRMSEKQISKKNTAKTPPRKSVKPIKSSSLVRHMSRGARKRNSRKITAMMFTITVVFILSYLPFIIVNLLDSADPEYWKDMSPSMSVFADFMLRFYLINTMANAIIYSFWDEKFRRQCIYTIKRICFCCKICNKIKSAGK